MKRFDIFLAVIVVLIWGSYFSASKIVLISFPPMLFASLRFFLLFIITSAYIFKEKLPLKDILSFSLIFMFNMFTINRAIDLSLDLTPIILLNELAVPASVLLGIFFFKEKFFLKDLIGIIIALIGFTIVINTRSVQHISLEAIILIILAAISFAFYNLLSKKLASFNALSVISYSSLLIFPVFLTASYFQETWPSLKEIQLESVIALLYLVIIGSLVAFLIWLYLLKIYPMGKVVLFTLLSPVFGCIIVALTLNENIRIHSLLGGAIIITGLIIIEFRRHYAKKEF